MRREDGGVFATSKSTITALDTSLQFTHRHIDSRDTDTQRHQAQTQNIHMGITTPWCPILTMPSLPSAESSDVPRIWKSTLKMSPCVTAVCSALEVIVTDSCGGRLPYAQGQICNDRQKHKDLDCLEFFLDFELWRILAATIKSDGSSGWRPAVDNGGGFVHTGQAHVWRERHTGQARVWRERHTGQAHVWRERRLPARHMYGVREGERRSVGG